MLQQGSLFDNRYELTRFIGRGGFAEVWLVKDYLTGLEEALKIYAPGSGMDEDGLRIFVKELSVVHDLRHTNLLTPKTLGQYEHQPYLVLPFCPNGSLNKKIGQCSEDELWKIMQQVASGLAYLHQRNIVHQDIKPDNILSDANKDYVITDFGISVKAQSTLRRSTNRLNSGTMAYMAPERFSAEPSPIPANDIWSLGAMMFELVEGNVPFLAQLGGLAQMNGAKLPTMHATVSNKLKESILCMLALNAEDRPTATQIAESTRQDGSTKHNAPEAPHKEAFLSDQSTKEKETKRINDEKLFQVSNDSWNVDSNGPAVEHQQNQASEKSSDNKKTQRIKTPVQGIPQPPVSSGSQPRFCRKCGSQLKVNQVYCSRCGTKSRL